MTNQQTPTLFTAIVDGALAVAAVGAAACAADFLNMFLFGVSIL